MTRRGLFGVGAAALASLVLDPDKLLWRPGAKLVSIPALRPLPPLPGWARGSLLRVGDVFTIANDPVFGLAQFWRVTEAAEDAGAYVQFGIERVTGFDVLNGFGELKPEFFA